MIQSDFITQASREDVFHNPRNEALLDAVAEIFRDAVLKFAEHKTLQYQWLSFLPDEDVSDEFWAKLAPKIKSLLEDTPILRPWSERGLFKPSQLKYLPPTTRDEDGNPLFADLVQEIYLAKGYPGSFNHLLKSLGNVAITIGEIYDRVKADLKKDTTSSRTKSALTSLDWHSRTAKLISTPFERGWKLDMNRARALQIIPLVDDDWVSANDTWEIYFPGDGPCGIPQDLGLLLVKPSALDCLPRKELFSHLGVKHCPSEEVIDAIIRKHGQPRWGKYQVANIVHHLRYLYHFLPEDVRKLDEDITVEVFRGGVSSRTHPSTNRIYFNDSDHEYQPQLLFANKGEDEPGLDVFILRKEYDTLGPSDPSWRTWLEQVAGIQRIPPPCEEGQLQLSEEFEYLLEYRTDMLFGLLRRHWQHYAPNLSRFQKTLSGQIIKSQSSSLIEICNAYAPLTRLTNLAQKFGLGGDPFIPVPDDFDDENEGDWLFLTQLGVRFTDDLNFYLEALKHFSRTEAQQIDENVLFEVYEGLQNRCLSVDDCLTTR